MDGDYNVRGCVGNFIINIDIYMNIYTCVYMLIYIYVYEGKSMDNFI